MRDLKTLFKLNRYKKEFTKRKKEKYEFDHYASEKNSKTII